MPSPNSNAQHAVTAVIVAHDGAAWIPHVTEGLLSQSRPVDRVVAVDTGSRDRSGAMLAEALGRGAVFGMDRDTGYGAAVHQALRHRAANTHLPPVPGAPAERVEWVWLLHDDCEPEADALERLLAEAAQTSGAAVLGPKVMDWSDRGVLLEAGVSIDRVGRRHTGVEPRELDQGQHDGDRDVLAVGSAGMLVRRDVWERVGGFDPAMRLCREDVDLCWRVLAAGHRVRVVTDAIVYHVEASARNRRATSAAPRLAREDRRNALLVLAGNLPLGPMISALAASFALSLLRTIFFLLAKRPGAALDESAACVSVIGHPLRLLSARRRRARGRRNIYGRVRGNIPPGRSLRRLGEYAALALSRSSQSEMVGSHHATEDPSDDDSLLVDSGVVQRLLTNPGVLLFLVLTVLALVAARSVLGSSPLSGGALAPAWGGASALWQEYLQGFHPVGIGTAASTPPYVALIAALATLLGGKPWLAVDVLLIGSAPLAGMTAYLAARRVTTFVGARVWAAATYALLPVGMGAVAAGRLGTAAVLVLLPLIGLLMARVFTQPRRQARRAAWATAFVVALAAAFVPLVWLIAVAVMGGGLLAQRRRPALSPLNGVIVAGVPLLLLGPWTMDLLAHPGQFFLEAGLQRAGLANAALPARSLLLLSPGGPGLPPWWVMAGLVAAAVVALLRRARRETVLAGWGVAVIGLLGAAVASRIVAMPAAGGPAVTAWPGAALAVAGAGLALAAAAAADPMPQALRSGRWRSPQGLAALALAALAASAPALAGVFWAVGGVNGPLAPSAGPLLPENVQVFAARGARVRTLVLRVSGHDAIQYSVLRASDPMLGDAELATPSAAQNALDRAVAALTAADGRDLGNQAASLARFGIGYVLVPAPVNAGLAHLLNDVAGLSTVSQTSSFELWQVAGTPARVAVVEPNGTVVPVASGVTSVSGARAPAAGGTLVIAEPAGDWSASVDGRPLTPMAAPVYGWAQGFRLPAGGGLLSVSRDEWPRELAVALECLAVVVVAGLGLPGARVAGEAEAEAAAPTAAASRQRPAGVGAGGDSGGGASPKAPDDARGAGRAGAARQLIKGRGRVGERAPGRRAPRRGGEGAEAGGAAMGGRVPAAILRRGAAAFPAGPAARGKQPRIDQAASQAGPAERDATGREQPGPGSGLQERPGGPERRGRPLRGPADIGAGGGAERAAPGRAPLGRGMLGGAGSRRGGPGRVRPGRGGPTPEAPDAAPAGSDRGSAESGRDWDGEKGRGNGRGLRGRGPLMPGGRGRGGRGQQVPDGGGRDYDSGHGGSPGGPRPGPPGRGRDYGVPGRGPGAGGQPGRDGMASGRGWDGEQGDGRPGRGRRPRDTAPPRQRPPDDSGPLPPLPPLPPRQGRPRRRDHPTDDQAPAGWDGPSRHDPGEPDW